MVIDVIHGTEQCSYTRCFTYAEDTPPSQLALEKRKSKEPYTNLNFLRQALSPEKAQIA